MEHRLIYVLPDDDPNVNAAINEWLQSHGVISETAKRIEIDPAMATVKVTIIRSVTSGHRQIHGYKLQSRRLLDKQVTLFFNLDRLPNFIEAAGVQACGHPIDDWNDNGGRDGFCLACRKKGLA